MGGVFMIKKIYINNFRSFQNFTIDFEQNRSALILGRNGSGKSNLFRVIQILKNIGDGEGSVVNLVSKGDFSYGDTSKPMRFEFDILIAEVLYKYTIVFEFPVNFKEARIKEEILVANGVLVLSRQEAQIEYKTNDKTLEFLTDWHKVALPIIQTRSEEDAVAIFKNWISKMIVLSPIPQLMEGESIFNDTKIKCDASNIGSWAKSIFSQSPKSYMYISKYLSKIMFDLDEIENRSVTENTNKLVLHFLKGGSDFFIEFDGLSNGEKIFF
jgi:AAA15 family ATPase/GTPase